MNFNFDLHVLFSEGVSMVNSQFFLRFPKHSVYRKKLNEVVDKIGENSCKAQGLSQQITTANQLLNSSDKVYLFIDYKTNQMGSVFGFAKVGIKHLYLFTPSNDQTQKDCFCLLDFYVHESLQRQGYGKQLMHEILKKENVPPQKIAVSRPSPKCLSFMLKHYNLSEASSQPNRFTLFHGFFNEDYSKNEENQNIRTNSCFASFRNRSSINCLDGSDSFCRLFGVERRNPIE